jgi:hypothetical protein
MIKTSQPKVFVLIAINRHLKFLESENAVQQYRLSAAENRRQPVNMLSQDKSSWVWLGSMCYVKASIVVTYWMILGCNHDMH